MTSRGMRLTLVGLLALFGCASDDGPVSWDEFRSAVYQDPDTGVYVLNGDETAETVDDLAEMYQRYRAVYDAVDDGIGESQHPLTINVVGGAQDKWSASAALNITYCVSTKGFSASRRATLLSALASATADWEAAANVNFVHLTAEDSKCNSRNNNVVFNVAYVCRGQYLASAFFPSYSRRNRQLSVDCTAFGNISPWSLTGVIRHELGHTLGFRHEHVVAPTNPCPEGGAWEQLTAYDSSSVMHYPQCEGTQTGDLVLTSLDRSGARSVYP